MTATSPGTARRGEGARRPGFLSRADFRGALDFTALTAGVLAAVCALYGLGVLLGTVCHYLGELLYAAANGA